MTPLGSGIVGVLATGAKLIFALPVFVLFVVGGYLSGESNAQNYDAQYKQLEASLSAPTLLAKYPCSGLTNGVEWQLWSVSKVDPGNPNPEVAQPPSVHAWPAFKLSIGGKIVYDSGAVGSMTVPRTLQKHATTSAEVSLEAIASSLHSTSTAALELVRTCLIAHAQDIAPRVQFIDFGNEVKLQFRTTPPQSANISSSTVATVPIPGSGVRRPVWVTVRPGQRAVGVVEGHRVELTVDKETAVDVLPATHMFIDGVEATYDSLKGVTVGSVSFEATQQYGDGSVQWDIFY